MRHSVLMITGRADPGGGPEHVLQLSKASAAECDIYIACPREKPYWDRYVSLVGAARMVEIPHRRFSLSAVRTMARFVEEQNIAIVHSHGRAAGLYGRLVAKKTRRPSVHTPHGPIVFRSPKSIVFWVADFLLSHLTDATIAVSETEQEILRRQRLHGRNLKVVVNGVPVPENRTVREFAAQPGPLRLAHVTRFVPQKYSELVLDVLEELRSRRQLERFVVDVLGDGPGRSAFEQEAARRGLTASLSFHGALPSIAPVLQTSFAFLSTSRWEGLPLAVLESLAVGVPVVASNVPGNSDVVSSKVGGLYELHQPARAAELLITMADAPDLWREKSLASHRHAREVFSSQRMAKETLSIYRGVLRPGASVVEQTTHA